MVHCTSKSGHYMPMPVARQLLPSLLQFESPKLPTVRDELG